MRPKYKVYGFRLLASLIVGLLNGLLRVDPSVGLLSFIFAYFLVTPMSLRIWREELKGTGLMDLYKEAIGASILVLILTWSLAMSFTGYGVAVYVVRAKGSGIYPIETQDGRILPPNNEELFGYNAVSLNISGGALRGAKVGVCLEGEGNISLRMGDYDLSIRGEELTVRMRLNLSKSEERDLLKKIFGNLTLYRNGTLVLNGSSFPPETTRYLELGASHLNITHRGIYIVELELRTTLKSRMEFPANLLLSEVRKEGSQLCVFDAKEVRVGRRSLNVRDRYYVVVLAEG
ncbi:MAG: hypothetical protein BA066_01255 [Candidatus Korarchaeota archaeon NZ13-K]|nr:MAG: hypothetical protein BA066_01255 [Candidatus Korarchaeota archaeon NZ13-K]